MLWKRKGTLNHPSKCQVRNRLRAVTRSGSHTRAPGFNQAPGLGSSAAAQATGFLPEMLTQLLTSVSAHPWPSSVLIWGVKQQVGASSSSNNYVTKFSKSNAKSDRPCFLHLSAGLVCGGCGGGSEPDSSPPPRGFQQAGQGRCTGASFGKQGASGGAGPVVHVENVHCSCACRRAPTKTQIPFVSAFSAA